MSRSARLREMGEERRARARQGRRRPARQQPPAGNTGVNLGGLKGRDELATCVARTLFVFVLCASTLVLGAPSAIGESRAFTAHFHIDGAAVLQGSTCPFGDWTPTVDTECEDWLVVFFKESAPRQHNRSPWFVELFRARVIVHPDGTVDVVQEAYGITDAFDASFDERHLLSASVRAAIPMSDGSTRTVDLAWDGTNAPLQVAGNNGPFNISNGFFRHYVDRCVTFNRNTHQTYRANVDIVGMIDGTDVHALPYIAPFDPFISRGSFSIVVAEHGGCKT